MALDWKNITFGSKFLEKLFLCINARCISSFFCHYNIITITLIIVAVNENALLEGYSCKRNYYTFIQLFFNKTFCAVAPSQILMFYSVWEIKEGFFYATQICHSIPCFQIKRRAERQQCGTSLRELWKWAVILCDSGNVRGFSFLWLKLYFNSSCQKLFQSRRFCCPSAQPVALGRHLLQATSRNNRVLKCLNGVQLKFILKCPQLTLKNDASPRILKYYKRHINSSEK